MTKNITIIILALTLTLVTFLSLMMFSNYQHDMLSMTDQQLKSDNLHLEALDGLTQQYNQLVANYDNLNSQYLQLGKAKGLIGNWTTFLVTAYTANDIKQGTSGITYIGIRTDTKIPICAVDPSVIPIGTIIEVKGLGIYLCADTGGLIKGNRIDLLFSNKDEAINFGKIIKDVRIVK